MKITDDAEGKLPHATELSNNRGVFVTSIVDGEPIKGAVLGSGSNFLHRTGHQIFAPVNEKRNRGSANSIKIAAFCVRSVHLMTCYVELYFNFLDSQ